jgi:hypothetical protein
MRLSTIVLLVLKEVRTLAYAPKRISSNKHSRKIISEEGSTDRDWIETIAGCADDGYLEGIYFFLRKKPELCARASVTDFEDA